MDNSLFLNICEEYAKQSKCISMGVGCIITNSFGRIIASGVNGTISGFENCNDHHFEDRCDHHEWSLENEIHAEMNAILELSTSSSISHKFSFYITHNPCNNCLKHILGLNRNTVSIEKIVFRNLYHRTTKDDINRMINMCNKLGIEIYHENEKLCSET